MQWDFIFADLQVDITFDAEAETPFGRITDNELEVLRGLVYSTLCTFVTTRALYLKEIVESLERIEQAGSTDKGKDKGG